MKQLFEAFKGYIIGFLILVLFFSVVGIRSCIHRNAEVRQEVKAEKAISAVYSAKQVDSIRTHYILQEIAAIDSTRSAERQISTVAHYAVDISNKKTNKLQAQLDKERAENDSLKVAKAPCAEMLDSYIRTNRTLGFVSLQKDTTIKELGIEAESYSRQLYLCDKQQSKKDSIITSKEQLLKTYEQNFSTLACYREWGEGHKFLKWLFGWKCRK